MNEEQVIAALRALAAASADARPSSAVETRLLAAFDEYQSARASVRRRTEWRAWALAAAAVLVLAAGFALAQRDFATSPDLAAGAGQTFRSGAEEETSAFVPWPGAAALPAFESGQLVRTELPASVLPLLGISQADAPAGGYVTADVLYAQDGLARAVRIVP